MSEKRLPMRKIKDILRLKFDYVQGQRRIARSCGVANTTLAECLARFKDSGLSWAEAVRLDDASLERRLHPPEPGLPSRPHSAGLAGSTPGTAPQGRDAVAGVARVHGNPSPGLPFQLVQRSVPCLGRQAGPDALSNNSIYQGLRETFSALSIRFGFPRLTG